MTTKKPHASAGTKSPASSEESTASTAAKTAEKPPTGSVAGYVASASSKATKRAYASDVRHFIQHGGAIPATPAMVAEYLAKLAPAMKVATLERRCVSIAQAHRDQGLKSPTRADVVVATMKGIRRQHGTRQRAVKPITRDVLLEMLAVLDQQKSHPTKAARDRALLLVGFAGAFRRAELVALRVEDVAFHETHVEVLLRFSKTDQFGKGRSVFLPQASGERCPIKSLKAWLAVAGIETGWLFRSVTKGGVVSDDPLTAQSVALIVKRAAKAMGREPEEFSGHSLRAGYVTTAAMASLPTWLIREQTGHRSDAVLARYIRPVEKRKIPSLL